MLPDEQTCSCGSSIPGMHFESCKLCNTGIFEKETLEKEARMLTIRGIFYGCLISIIFWALFILALVLIF
jgi:uncharacterized membrane protein